jgi:hypothetical protein
MKAKSQLLLLQHQHFNQYIKAHNKIMSNLHNKIKETWTRGVAEELPSH